MTRKIGSDIRLVIGMDVGDGESAAYFTLLRNSDGTPVEKCEIKSLQIKHDKNKIISDIQYQNKNIDIGLDHHTGGVLLQHFKRSPTDWDEECAQIDGVSKTYQDVMRDFIAKLAQCIMAPNVNPQLADFKNKKTEIAVFVGCPSAEIWTSPDNIDAYETLILEATGFQEAHVVPESTAAVFSSISSETESGVLAPAKGIAVFDFGSSTADFTYISLGRTLAEISWTLGAASIEENIISKVLAEEGFSSLSIPITEWSELALNSRKEYKEAWFGDTDTSGLCVNEDENEMSIAFIKRDEEGNILYADPSKKTRPQKNHIDFQLNNEFMDDVLNDMEIPNVRENGKPAAKGSWSDICRQFYQRCKGLMQTNNLNLDTIILTGGASKMDFVEDLCRSVFGEDVRIYRDTTPSFCVCRGLCQMAINRVKLEDIIDTDRKELENLVSQQIDIYRELGKTTVSESILEEMLKFLAKTNDDITVGEFQKNLQSHFKEVYTPEKMESLLKQAGEKLTKTIAKEIQKRSGSAAAVLYNCAPNNEDLNFFKLDLDLLVNKQKSLAPIFGNNPFNNPMFLGMFMIVVANLVAFATASVAAIVLGMIIPILAPLAFIIVYDMVDDYIQEHPNHRIAHPKELAARIRDNQRRKKQMLENINTRSAGPVMKEIMDQQFGTDNKDYIKRVSDSFIDAIKIVALEKFEQRITE